MICSLMKSLVGCKVMLCLPGGMEILGIQISIIRAALVKKEKKDEGYVCCGVE